MISYTVCNKISENMEMIPHLFFAFWVAVAPVMLPQWHPYEKADGQGSMHMTELLISCLSLIHGL